MGRTRPSRDPLEPSRTKTNSRRSSGPGVGQRAPGARCALLKMIYAGSLVFSAPRRVTDFRDWTRGGPLLEGANWRHPYGPKSRSCMCRLPTRSPLRSGPAGCSDYSNGSSPHGEASTAGSSPGVIRFCPVAGIWPTPGGEISRPKSLRRRP